MQLCSGGNIIDKIPIYRDDFTQHKYDLIDGLNMEYCYRNHDYMFNNNWSNKSGLDIVWFDDEIDNYNGHNNENSYLYLSSEFANKYSEEVYIKSDNRYFYFILHDDYNAYSCDKCGGKFLDAGGHYIQNLKKFSTTLMRQDLCNPCYQREKREMREVFLSNARDVLYENGKIPTSRQQKYLCNLFKGVLNKKISKYFVDIFLETENIVIEYDGSGHWLQSIYSNKITIEDVNNKDERRDLELMSNGCKVLRIRSQRDELPSDKELLLILENAKMKFSQGESRVVIDIENNNYKKLRKIKKKDVEV